MTELLQYLASGLVVGCIYGLVGVGYTAIFNVTGIVNFAQGDAAMLGALTTVTLLALGLSMPLAIAAAVLAVALLFVVIEFLAIRPIGTAALRGRVVTIGISVALQGVAVVLWGTDAQAVPAFSGETPIDLAGITIAPQSFWILGTTVLLMVGLQLFFSYTYLGKVYRACAMNAFAAGLMGVPTRSMRSLGFLISGAFGAVAGIIVAPVSLMQYDSGVFLGIKGFVACVIGGFGNPLGAALGGLVLGLLESLSTGYLSSGFKNAIAFVVLLVFLCLRPGGLLGDFNAVKR